MAWIHMISEDEADEALKAMYKEVAGRWGGLDAIMQIHSLNPPSLPAHQLLYKALMYGKSGLNRVQREMIAVVVSAANKCYYWVAHHGDGHLYTLTKNRPLIEVIKVDYRKADLSEKDRAMLDYCVKLTEEPWNMAEADVQRLRETGFNDRDILDMAMITGYFAFANRLADGLGIDVEDFFIRNVIEKKDT